MVAVKRKVKAIRVVTIDPIVPLAAEIVFAPPTSSCSFVDARIMAEQAFESIGQLRDDSESLTGTIEDLEEKIDENKALESQFSDYQDMLREFLQATHPGIWDEWITYRLAERARRAGQGLPIEDDLQVIEEG